MAQMPDPNRLLAWLHQRQIKGRHRLHQLLASSAGTSPLICAETRYGARLLLNPYEYVDSFILRYGFYESEVFEALKPYLSQASTFWDIGSNTGLHGVSAKVCFPELNVVCVEPVPALSARILDSARLNQAGITLVAAALGAHSGSAWINVTPGNLGMSHVAQERGSSGSPALMAAVLSGDELIASGQVPAPDVIKIDTEGSEEAALTGLARALRSVKAIAFEAGADVLTDPHHAIRRHLDPHGFRYRQLVRNEPTDHNLENFIAER